MYKLLFPMLLSSVFVASAQQVAVPRDQQVQYDNERRANNLRSTYLRQQAAAMQSYQNCQDAQKRRAQANPHYCDPIMNTANYYGKMAGSVRTPTNPLTGSVTDQPLPANGSTRNMPGGVAAGVIYGVTTNQTRFNTNPNTISDQPVVDSRDKINNSNGRGGWQQYAGTVRQPNRAAITTATPVRRPIGVNGNGYRQVPAGAYIPKYRK